MNVEDITVLNLQFHANGSFSCHYDGKPFQLCSAKSIYIEYMYKCMHYKDTCSSSS